MGTVTMFQFHQLAFGTLIPGLALSLGRSLVLVAQIKTFLILVFCSIYPSDTPISRSLGVIKQVMVMVMVIVMVMVTVMVKVEKYMKLHRELLGGYDPLHLPARPSQEALERMRGANANI